MRTFDANGSPLTLEELRKMDGEPVYMVQDVPGKDPVYEWGLVSVELGRAANDDSWLQFEDYGIWRAYRRSPGSADMLTLDELKQMHKEPMFVVFDCPCVAPELAWGIVNVDFDQVASNHSRFRFGDYGEVWWAFRDKCTDLTAIRKLVADQNWQHPGNSPDGPLTVEELWG